MDLPSNAEQLFLVDLSDCDLEDDFVCEGDLEGRGARAGFVPRDASPGEGSEEECHVFLRKRGPPAQGLQIWGDDMSCHVSKFK